MSLTIRPLEECHVQDAARISLAAFKDDATYQVVFPNMDSPESVAHEAEGIRKTIHTKCKGPNPTAWEVGVFDDAKSPPELISYISAYVCEPPAPGESTLKRTPPPDANHEAWYEVAPYTAGKRREVFGQDNTTYLYLALVTTAESGRRRGGGTMGVEYVKQISRDLRLPMCIQAAAVAAPLYRKLGCRDVSEMRKDLSKFYGHPKIVTDYLMQWDPSSCT